MKKQKQFGQATGNNINITDSSDLPLTIDKIKGNHYQDSREGYNLLDFKETNTAITTSGLNYKKNSDGSIEVSGTTNRAWDYTMTNKYTFKAGKTYTVMANITGQATPTFYFKFNSANGGVKNVANGSKTTITIKEDQELNLMLSLSANFTVNFKAYILLYEGTEDKPYEQYGASPSIDYPSEIKTVKDSVEIDVVNKNLLNFANTEETTKGGITYSIKNGILKLNGTTTASFDIKLSKNIKIKKGKYTHSSSYIQSGLYISFDNLRYTMISSTFGKKRTLEITEDKTYKTYFIWIDKGTVLNNVEIKLQLEVGSTATDFVEHQSQSVIMPIQQEMLEGDYIDKDGEHHEWGKLVLTGDEKDSVFEQFNNATGLVYFRVICEWKEKNGKVVSNMLKVSSKDLSEIEQSADLIYSIVSRNEFFIMLKDSSITSVALLKAKLKELNEAGTPLTIYYEIRKDKDVNIYVDAPKTRYLLNDEQNEALTTELNAYQNITNIDASNELASVDVTYYTNNKSNKIYVKEYELEKLDKQLGNEFQKLDSNIQKLESATEYPNYFLRLISAKSTQKYTINSGEITQIQLEKFNYNGSFYGEFISVYSGMIDISRDIYLDISGAIKFYTSPKENCNISLCLLKYLYDNETESFSVKEELFSTDILKATTDSKVSAVIPSTIIYAQTNDIVGLGFKSNISGEYTIMQDPQNSFLKIRPISRIIQRPQ